MVEAVADATNVGVKEPLANDGRIKVFDGEDYVPNKDLMAVKGSLTRQRDEALEAISQQKSDLERVQGELAGLKARTELGQVDESEARKLLLKTQERLTQREQELKKQEELLKVASGELATKSLAAARERIAAQYTVDVEVLKEFNNDKDMELAALKLVMARKPVTNRDLLNGGSPGISGTNDPLVRAREAIDAARRIRR